MYTPKYAVPQSMRRFKATFSRNFMCQVVLYLQIVNETTQSSICVNYFSQLVILSPLNTLLFYFLLLLKTIATSRLHQPNRLSCCFPDLCDALICNCKFMSTFSAFYALVELDLELICFLIRSFQQSVHVKHQALFYPS